MTKELYINIDPDFEADVWDASDALKSLIKQYDNLSKTVLKAERQLMKFDEINRLVAYEVKEKEEKAAKASGGSSKSSSSTKKSSGSVSKGAKAGQGDGSVSGQKKPSPQSGASHEAQLPLYFTIKDVLFNWDDLNWEQIMMKIIAGLGALGGAVIGGMIGGVPGAIIGLGAGLLFGITLDNSIFNFDGELSTDEIWKSLLSVLSPIAGGIIGFIAGGPFGAALGITLGVVFSLVISGINWEDIFNEFSTFFRDLEDNFTLRWNSFKRLVSEAFSGIKTWWQNLSFGKFNIKLPHLVVEWQQLANDSVLAKFLGVTAIPHLSVEWYARGGIVDGATLIGAGENGKEAIIPLERNTFWIHEVAVQLKEELEKLAPENAVSLINLPAAATGALVPPSAAAASAPLDLSSLAETIANAISGLNRNESDPIIRVYLDGKQLSDAVTKYQRRNGRAFG